MAQQFFKMSSLWWDQDLPYDANGLIRIRDNMIADWDRTAPVLTYSFPTFEAPITTTPSDEDKIAMYNWTCLWARPIFLLPGMEKIRVHFRGMFGPSGDIVALQLAQHLGQPQHISNVDNNPLVTVGEDYVLVTADGTVQTITLELNYGIKVQQPTFTVLQLWFASNFETGGTGSLVAVGSFNDRYLYDTNGLSSPSDTDTHLNALVFYDSAGTTKGVLDVLEYDTSIGGSGNDGWAVFPRLTGTLPVDWVNHSLLPLSWVAPAGLVVEYVREPGADFLYLPTDAELRPDQFTYSQVMDQFESVSHELAFRHRPQTVDIKDFGADNNSSGNYVDYDLPVGTMYARQADSPNPGYINKASEVYVPLSMPHEQHQVVRVALLVNAYEYRYSYERSSHADVSVQFEAELVQVSNDTYRGLEAAGYDEDLIETLDEVLQTMPPRAGRLSTEWSPLDAKSFHRFGPLLSREDLATLNPLDPKDKSWNLVFLTLRGVPNHVNYAASDQEKPWALKLSMTIADDQYLRMTNRSLEVFALPYVWTEGYPATPNSGADSGDEEIALLRETSNELWLDFYDYKPLTNELTRSYGVNLNALGVEFADMSTFDFDRVKVIGGGAELSQPPPGTPALEQSTQYLTGATANPDAVPHMVVVPDQVGAIVGVDDSAQLQQLPVDGSSAVWANSAVQSDDLYERLARTNNGAGQSEDIIVLGKSSTIIYLADWDSGASSLLLALGGTGYAVSGSKEDPYGCVVWNDGDPQLTVFKANAEYDVELDAVVDGNAGTFSFTGEQGSVVAEENAVDAIVDGNAGSFSFTGQQGSVVAEDGTSNAIVDGNAGSFSFTGQQGSVVAEDAIDDEIGLYSAVHWWKFDDGDSGS